jgi:pSer/pThr/pTyr-binding forkhead associated (FHA) protein
MDAVVSLHMVDSGQIVNLTGQTEFTIGRTAEGQPILPDVDLSPYEAYAKGVSRLHSALKIHNQRVVITDLGSSNGTRVNGQKIVPHVDYPLNHGDMIALGKFTIQLLIRK